MNILFVCNANRCRSAFLNALGDKLESNHTFSSAGVEAKTGYPATEDVLKTAEEYGLDLSGHSSRTIKEIEESLPDFNLIIACTSRQKSILKKHYPNLIEKTYLLSQFGRFVKPGDDLSDPTGMGPLSHQNMLRILTDCFRAWSKNSWNPKN